MRFNPSQKYAAEFIGTAFLLATVVGFFVGGLVGAGAGFVSVGLIGSVLAFAVFLKMRGGI